VRSRERERGSSISWGKSSAVMAAAEGRVMASNLACLTGMVMFSPDPRGSTEEFSLCQIWETSAA